MIGDDELAVIVRALTFQLVNPTSGQVVAELGAGVTGPFPTGFAFSRLTMFHLDPTTSDSVLAWTQNGASGDEYVALQGPNGVPGGAVQAYAPTIYLYHNTFGPNPITGVSITTGEPDGSPGPNANPGFIMETEDGGTGLQTRFDVFSSIPVELYGGGGGGNSFRGFWPGVVTAEATLGASANFRNIGATLITLPQINSPIGGGFIDVSATIVAQLLIAGNQGALTILVDGAPYTVLWNAPGGTPVNTILPMTLRRVIPVGAGNHNISLTCGCGAADNAFLALAGYTVLSAEYHR